MIKNFNFKTDEQIAHQSYKKPFKKQLSLLLNFFHFRLQISKLKKELESLKSLLQLLMMECT